MEIRVRIDDHNVRSALDGMAGRLESLEPVMDLVGQFVCEVVDENFQAEGRPDAWDPLKKVTLARKKAGQKILEGESGRLREGIHVEDSGKNFVIVAPDDLVYARIHQLGGQAGRNLAATIPARPYLVLQPGDEEHIEGLITDFVMGRL